MSLRKFAARFDNVNGVLNQLILVATLLFGFSLSMFSWGDGGVFAVGDRRAAQFPAWMLAKFGLPPGAVDAVSINFAADVTNAAGVSFGALVILITLAVALAVADVDKDSHADMERWFRYISPVIPIAIAMLVYAANEMFSAANWYTVALFPNYHNLTRVGEQSHWRDFLSGPTLYSRTFLIVWLLPPVVVVLVWAIANDLSFTRSKRRRGAKGGHPQGNGTPAAHAAAHDDRGEPLALHVKSPLRGQNALYEDTILSKLADAVANELQRRSASESGGAGGGGGGHGRATTSDITITSSSSNGRRSNMSDV